jgi:hypothetical protein
MKNQILKIASLFIIFMSMTVMIKAQDIIYLYNGKQIKVKIDNITSQQIRYKPFENLDGPIKIIDKKAVLMIVYEDGHSDVFAQGNKKSPKSDSIKLGNNLISFHVLDILFNDLTLSYERILPKGYLGLTFPVSLGIGEGVGSIFNFVDVYSGGIGLNYYPSGQKNINYLMGIILKAGKGKSTDNSIYVNNVAPEMFYSRILINNGFCFCPVPGMRISLYFSLGLSYYDKYWRDNRPAGFYQSAGFSFNTSCRF